MAKHSLPQSSNRQAILLIVAVSTVLAIASIFGTIWIVRVGVLIAIAGTALVVWMAWRELVSQRRAHRLEVRAQTMRATEAAERHHAETMEVIDRFSTRHHALTERFQLAQRQLEQAKVELASVKGTLIATQLESRQRAARISELEATVASHTAELAELAKAQEESAAQVSAELVEIKPEAARAEGATGSSIAVTVVSSARAAADDHDARSERDDSEDGSGQVAQVGATGDLVALPRYGAASKRVGLLPTARELWADGNEPDVVNINRVAFPTPQQRQA